MMEPTLEETPQESRFRFNIITLLWVTAMIGVGVGVYGKFYGISWVVLVLLMFGVIVVSRLNYKNSAEIFAFLFCFTALATFVINALPHARVEDSHFSRMNSVKQLCLSALNYQTTESYFPKPYTEDSKGERLHSWRTLILPYMEEQPLFDSLDLKLAWNNSANLQKLKSCIPHAMQGDHFIKFIRDEDSTDAFAIIDEATVWDPDGGVGQSDVTDGPGNTIMLIEALDKNIRWYEPRDLTLEEAIDLLVGDVETEWTRVGYFSSQRLKGSHLYKRVVCFADAHAEFIGPVANRKIARALLTRSGGEELPKDWRNHVSTGKPNEVISSVYHWDHIGSSLLFLALALIVIRRGLTYPVQQENDF